MDREQLLSHLENESGVFKLPGLKEAFTKIDRADFLSEEYQPEAYEDYAVPIGFDQKLGKPTVIAFMLELLEIKKGEKALEIGSGAGWTTALMAHIVGPKGSVLALELVPELFERACENLAKYKFKNATIIRSEGALGHRSVPPYDRILVTSSVESIPENLIAKLNVGGILVVPVGDTIYKIVKNKNDIETFEYPGFMFSAFNYE
jgi:protein-L-isoaspartate(D-aspartate) O-methyltransferase